MAPASIGLRLSTERLQTGLAACGILAAVLYVSMTLFVGLWWDGYSVTSQTISELSAIGAPTRPIWMLLGALYTALLVAFAWGVRNWPHSNRALRVVGALILTQTVFAFFWPPMHQRSVLAAGGGTLTDTLHLVWMGISGIFFTITIAVGAVAFGRRFRIFSIVTLVVALTCGVLTGRYAAAVEGNLPTPWLGVWERISGGAYMLWIAVMAITLLHRHDGDRRDHSKPASLAELSA